MKNTAAFFLIPALILGAFLCRLLAESGILPLPGTRLLETLRIFLYLGLFAFWGVSLKRRIMQREAGRLIVLVPMLEIFWLIVRELRWRYTGSGFLFRQLWYAYYLPILFIPPLILFVCWLLGKPEDAKLPRSMYLVLIPGLAMLPVVLTNDLHQWVFVSPWLETGYSYGPGYFLIVFWVICLAVCALAVIFKRLGLRRGTDGAGSLKRPPVYAPLLPLFAELVYLLLYGMRNPLIMRLLGDVALFHCLIFSAFLEACIRSGLILTNSRYLELFTAAEGLRAVITDSSGNVRYSSGNREMPACPIPDPSETRDAGALPAQTKAPLTESEASAEGLLRFSLPVNGGFCVWEEDISDLLALRDSLQAQQEELTERNELLRLEYDREKEHKIIEEQNRLYDLLQRMAGSRIARIDGLISRFQDARTKREKRLILARIVVFCSFIKRRRDFLLSSYALPQLPVESLKAALAESFRALSLLEIRGGYLVDTGNELAEGKLLVLAYDFFEDVMETVLEQARFFNVRVARINGELRCGILTDCAPAAGEALRAKYPALQLITEEDEGAEYILPLQ